MITKFSPLVVSKNTIFSSIKFSSMKLFTQAFQLFAFVLIATACHGQVFDDFSDGDFTTNPQWSGDQELFEIETEQLQTIGTLAGQAILFTGNSSSMDDKEWGIWVKQSFSGSGNNHSRIYLSASTSSMNFTSGEAAGVEGYFIQLGEAGSDDAIKLYRDDQLDDAPVLIAEGSVGTVSSSFEIALRVTRSAQGEWNIYADFTGGDDFILDAAGVDNTYSTTEFFGLACLYTASNADNFYFDDIYFGDPLVDTDAPFVQTATVITNTTIDLLFNEPLATFTAEDVANYSIGGIGSAQTATLDGGNSSLVHLTFPTNFIENETFVLTVSGVDDLAENSMITSTHDLIWVVVQAATLRDVVFNELLPDPNPIVGLPESEFVELYNSSSSAFDLANWEFVNSTTSKVLPSHILASGDYVILCDENNAELLQPFGSVIGISSFTALANTGDSLTLLDPDGQIIDLVVYSDSWYGDSEKADGGWTLEQINPETDCTGSGNWRASNDLSGGTPGAESSILDLSPDGNAPTISSVVVGDDATITIVFDEALDINSIDLADFTLNEGVIIENFTIEIEATSILLTLDLPLAPGSSYVLTVDEVADCSGNATGSIEYGFDIGFTPDFGDLIINEFLPDPDESIPSPNAEYIELYNKSANSVELFGIQLSGGVITSSYVLLSNDYVIIHHPNDVDLFIPYSNAIAMEGFPGLTNSGTELELYSEAGDLLDALEYDLSWYQDSEKDEGGWSIELMNPNDPCSDADNWRASVANFGATPGEENSVFTSDPDSDFPILLWPLVHDSQTVEFVFDEGLSSDLDAITFTLLDESGNDSGILPSSIEPGETNQNILITLESPLEEGIIYTAILSHVADCWGNIADESATQLALAEFPEPGDFIINEIMFDPTSIGSDYVEILNRSEKHITISNWQLANVDGGFIDNFSVMTEAPFVLFSGEHMVFTEDRSSTISAYPFAEGQNIIEVENLPAMSNSDGDILLFTPQLLESDAFHYDEDMHFELIDDVEGVSLERIDPWGETNNRSNWHSAATSQGYGTPGYLNSQDFQSPLSASEITIAPEVFSPDNDGLDDVVQIHYDFTEPGNIATVTIYNKNGVVIRRLVNNELLGATGSITWDGITDDNQKAPIGIYVILVETFRIDGSQEVYKESCVLAHPLK
ncbi:MAG: hypothetical protein ACI84C_000918 [Flavobacteriales bacterium]|jgi:hypothetical protein